MKRLFPILLLLCSIHAFGGNFTSGNIVVLRVGTGSTLLTSSAHPVFLDEYSRTGTLIQTIALPTATSGSNHPFALSGTATSEGTISLSANGQYIVAGGYDAVPGTPSVVGDSTINRVIARIGTNGVANTSTGILGGGAYVQDNIRGVASSDGTKFWVAGNGTFDRGGTYYLPFGSFTASPVKVSTPPNNTRTVSIFNNQLYISSQTNTYNGVSIVGSGLPTDATGNPTTLFPGFYSPSAMSVFSFWLFDMSASVPGMDVLYFCDDRDVAPNGGLYKYSLVNGTWVSNGNITVPNNLKGITAERTCFTQIFCSSGTRIFSFRDDGGYNQALTGALTQIAMAASNTKFRGIAFAPGTATLTALQVTDAGTNVSCFNAANGSITITASGGVAPYTYKWNNNSTLQNRSNLSPGTYTITVTDANGCTASESTTITQPAQLNVSASKTDVSCNGGNNGSITLTVTGGTASYSYAWNTGSTSQSRSNLSAGTYTVTVTDNRGCTATTSVTIAQPSVLSASATKTNVTCNGGNNGTVTLSVSGGTSPYDYDWSNNASTQNLSGVAAGTYTVTVTDARNCTATASATISQPNALSTTNTVVNVSCNGGNNGSIDLTVAGGTAPYTYNWSNGMSTQDVSSLGAASYSVTVSDGAGCSVVKSNISVSQPAALSASISKTNVSCYNGNNGAASLTVTGGTGSRSYIWSNQETSQNISALIAGIYNVTITDGNGCSTTAGTTVTQPAALSVSLTKTNVSCNGGNNGAIDLMVSGGTTNYTYAWSNNTGTQNLSSVATGVYTVTVTDANSCTITGSAAITEPAALSATLTKTDVTCHGGSNGAIDLSVSGGISGYTYGWSNQATSQDITSLTAGSYTVTIADANSCTLTSGVSISQPAALTTSLTKTDVLCNGANTGAINLTVNGGVLPYAYDWSNNATTQNISALGAATYDVVITDANNCTAATGATITEPAAISINQTITDASCNGGTDGAINITVSGGVAAYSFAWSNNATSEDISGLSAGFYEVTVTDGNSCGQSKAITIGESSALAITLIAKTDLTCTGGNNGSIDIDAAGGLLPYTYSWSNSFSTQDISNLAAGDYIVTVSDANNCSKVESYTVLPAPVLTATITRRNTNCNAGNDGSADLTVSGGTLPYTFEWSNNDSTEDINGLTAGAYIVTITDINGCNASAGTIISEPTAFTTSITKTDINCNGGNNGAIDLTVSGSTPSYTYAWSDSSSLQDAGNLIAGTYTVTITDSKGCTATTGATITEPVALATSLTAVNVLCKNGSDGAINLEVSGGVAPYSYDWSNGITAEDIIGLSAGTYSVTVQDANGCTTSVAATITEPDLLIVAVTHTDVSCFGGSDGSITLNVSGGTASYQFAWSHGDSVQTSNDLIAGNYAVTITDNNACSAIEGATIAQPTEISVTADVTNPPCSGGNSGAIDLTVSGGTAGYNFIWSNNDTTEDVSNLAASLYTVTITDSNGCVKTFSANVSQAGTLDVSTAATHVSCNGLSDGAIQLTVTGGTPSYTFEWSNQSATQNIDNLSAGIYGVTVSDVNGCSLAATDTITQADAIIVAAATTDITCFSAGNGAIDLTVNGGQAPYAFNWSNGADSEEITGLIAGTYSVTITDDNSCIATTSANITEPDSIVITAQVTDASSFGGTDGAIDVTIAGGAGSYSFNWSNSGTTEDLGGISVNEYCVTVTDANSCAVNACFTVDQPSSIDENVVVDQFTAFMLNEKLIIKAELYQPADGQLQVFDIAGKLLVAKAFTNTQTLNEEISFNIYAGGCYFVNVLTKKGTFSKKVVAVRQ